MASLRIERFSWHTAGLAAFLVGALPLRGVFSAEIRALAERNVGEAATPEFKFREIPPPSKTDAAVTARIEIAAGRLDPNGGDVEILNDGALPGNEDDPDANLFFAAGTEGGRLVLDLGAPTEIQRVNTYSWHRNTRGPQVYKLYASDGAAAGFDPKPGADVDPEKAGWVFLASVDTRPKEGNPGGQYGVTIFDPSGAALGKYRYLLFAVSRTEADDPFGNTFFSEIDVADGKEHAPPPAEAGKYDIRIDYSEMPELKEWVEGKLRPILEKWYPLIVEALPSEGYVAPRRVTVTFRRTMRGVAATSGTRIVCGGEWFRKNLEGEALGAVVHELVHVVQRYRRGNNPGWLVEGIADCIRWFHYEPESLRPRPDPKRAKYTDSYRTTGAFLHYLEESVDKDIVKKLNAAMREGRYRPEIWKEYTGKTVDELWADYVKTLEAR